MPTLCNTFRHEAGGVWNRMKTAANLGLYLSEETLTEWTAYNIARVHHISGDLIIDLATKAEEAIHGADWEWWFIQGNKNISFRVQAKRLFPKGIYKHLFKSGAERFSQLNKLVSDAASAGHVPLYCLYNFDYGPGAFQNHSHNCSHPYIGRSYWGCSVADPSKVQVINSDSLHALVPHMRPWHELVCLHSSGGLLESLSLNIASVSGGALPDGLGPRERSLPDYVSRLLHMGRLRRENPTSTNLQEERDDLSHSLPQGVRGIVTFEDTTSEVLKQ